jgi:hypothetical protein
MPINCVAPDLRCPDLTPYFYILWGYVNGTVFISLLKIDIPDVNCGITKTVASVIRDMLVTVWGKKLSIGSTSAV